jgi:pyrimidine operon attenuation protein/uracil phosphoribosyltransferase
MLNKTIRANMENLAELGRSREMTRVCSREMVHPAWV